MARYIKVTPEQRWATESAAEFFDADDEHEMSDRREVRALVAAYDAAEGQRVEEIRWCDESYQGGAGHGSNLDHCRVGYERFNCRIVEATLILPPRAGA